MHEPNLRPSAEKVSSRRERTREYLPVLLVLIYLVQCIWFIRAQSLTYDEPVHIAEGLDAWRHGRFEEYNDHPPLARLLCALPLIGEKWQVNLQRLDEGFHVAGISPDPESLAWRARAMNVLLGLLLACLVWFAADKLFSRSAANFALALFAFSPALIAHFSLVTTDGAAALLIFAAAWQLVRWKQEPSWRRAIQLGVVLGLLLLAKYSTGPMFAMALLWMLVLRPESPGINPLRWHWRKTASAALLALLVVWAGYFFHVSRLTVRDGTLTATFPNWHQTIVKPVHSPNYSVLIPAGEFVQGFREVMRHNRRGQPAFFLGQVSPRGGWKWYYPATILLKWPVVVLLLSFAAMVLVCLGKLRLPVEFWIMASFPAVYLCFALFARFNLGERHILPIYPFALLLAAAVWNRFSLKRTGKILLLTLVLANAVDVLRFAPGYLSYFTPFVRPVTSYRLLSDSSLDWGQGLLALRQYQNDHPAEQISLAYFGSLDPEIYGIKTKRLAENERATGTIVVSATNLSGQYLRDPNGYRWLLSHKPTAILDHSLYVFQITGN